MFKKLAPIPCLLIAMALAAPAAAGPFEDEARRFVGNAFNSASGNPTSGNPAPGKAASRVKNGNANPKASAAARFTSFIERQFVTKSLAGFVLGPYWRRASAAERSEFHSLFRIYLSRSIGRQAAQIASRPVEIDDVVTATGGNEVLVFSRLGRRGPAEVYIDWRIRRTKDGPKLIDVIVQGTSLATVHRRRFMGLMRRNGGSIAALNAGMKTRLKVKPAGAASLARNTSDTR